MTNHRVSLCALLLGLLALCALSAPTVADEKLDLASDVPMDPAIVTRAALPNGMRYWIRPHNKPRGSVSLVLHVASGSVQETKDQRGLAHFVEHMAFEGSKNFPPGTLIPYFSSLGITFGQHQNAHTAYGHTAYELQLPRYTEATFAKAVLFMSDVARHVSFVPEEVEKEIPVILEEFRFRGGVEGRLWRQRAPLLFYGSRYALRQPIGDKEVVRSATAARLRAYHETWYRPERTTLIVVGDVKPHAVESAIKKTFSDWKPPKRPPPKLRLGPLTTKGLRVGVFTDPDLHSARVAITHKRRSLPGKTYGDLKRHLIESLALRIMGQRLEYLRRTKSALFARGWMRRRRVVPGMEMIECGASGKEGSWIGCLREIVHEIVRVQRYGFDKDELDRVRANMLARYDSPGEATSAQIAAGLQEYLAEERVPYGMGTWKRVAHECLPNVTARDVTAVFRALFDLDNAAIAVSLQKQADESGLPNQPEVLEYYEEAREDKLRTWSERNARLKIDKILAKDPDPGAVASKQTDEELRVTALVMKNGVHVNLRKIRTPGRVYVRVRFLGGRIEETAKNLGITDLTFGSLSADGIATKSVHPDTVTRYLMTRRMGVDVSFDDAVINYDVWADHADLDDAMRLLRLLLTEPHVHYNAYKESYQNCCSWRWYALRDPGDVADDQLHRHLAGKDPRLRLPTWEDYQKVAEEAAQAWLTRIVTTAPLEVAIVGDIEPAAAEALACRWFGSLPERADRRKELAKLQVAKAWSGPVRREEKVESSDPGAIVVLAWRGVGRRDETAKAALHHAANVIDGRLYDAVREEHGLSYDVSARYVTEPVEGMGHLEIRLTTDPATAKRAADIAHKVVLKLAKEGPTEAELKTVALQWRVLLGLAENRPGSWLGSLTTLSLDGRDLAGAKAMFHALGKADGPLLKKTLARVIKDARFCQIIALPVPPKKDEKAADK